MRVIGISSPAQGGKDMVCDIIMERLTSSGLTTTSIRFADPLKDIVALFFGWDRRKLDEDIDYKNHKDSDWNNITPREALQIVGTEMFRKNFMTFWGISPFVHHTRLALADMRGWNSPPDFVFIPDVRFQDELKLVRAVGELIWVNPYPRIQPDPEGHGSEVEMWEWCEWNYEVDSGASMQKTIEESEEIAHKFFVEHQQGLLRGAVQ